MASLVVFILILALLYYPVKGLIWLAKNMEEPEVAPRITTTETLLKEKIEKIKAAEAREKKKFEEIKRMQKEKGDKVAPFVYPGVSMSDLISVFGSPDHSYPGGDGLDEGFVYWGDAVVFYNSVGGSVRRGKVKSLERRTHFSGRY